MWAAAQLKSLARKSSNDVSNLIVNLMAALSDVRYYAEPKPASADGLIRASDTVLSALTDAQQELTALAQVPTPSITIHPIRSRKK